MTEEVRKFDTGATRSSEAGRYDPEGFLSPIVIERFCEYMNSHRVQPDGSIRGSDNWQKGIPRDAYMKGAWRHMLHLWTRHRKYPVQDSMAAKDIEEDLCALLFNIQGYLFEVVKERLTFETPKIADDVWILSTSDDMPVSAATRVEVILRDGTHTIREAGKLSWDRLGFPTDIIKYRVFG